jgi:hypothetical protein
MSDEYGFIIIRHVNSSLANEYWKECYTCVRRHYPNNKIIIIDDNSDNSYLNSENFILSNTQIINSEYPGRAELLPYIYYLKNQWFRKAIIIHDSVFIQQYIDFSTETYKFLWYFEHDEWSQPEDEEKIIKSLSNHDQLLSLHKEKKLWNGCFGVMCVISHDFLKSLDDKHNLTNLLDKIKTRYNRCSFERVFGLMCILNHKFYNFHMFGNILKYCKWGITFSQYKNRIIDLPIVKVWTSR